MTGSDMLEDPQLLDKIIKAIQSTGVIGEEAAIKSEILIVVGKKTKNKSTISTNIHLEGQLPPFENGGL